MRTFTHRSLLVLSAVVALTLGLTRPAAAQSWLLHEDESLACGNYMYSGSGYYRLGCYYGYVEYLDDYTEVLELDYVGPGTHLRVWGSDLDGYWGGIHYSQYRVVGQGNGEAVMQGDANFVFYDGPPAWATNTQNMGSGGPYLNVQDDGNLVVYDQYDTPLWSI